MTKKVKYTYIDTGRFQKTIKTNEEHNLLEIIMEAKQRSKTKCLQRKYKHKYHKNNDK